MTAWVFVILFHLTVYGGEVIATIEFKDQVSCERARRDIMRMLPKAKVDDECRPVG